MWLSKVSGRALNPMTNVLLRVRQREFHGQRSLAGCRLWSRRESYVTQRITHRGRWQREGKTADGASRHLRDAAPGEHGCARQPPSPVQLCNRMVCSPPGSSVHAIPQARILECVASSSSRGSSRPRDGTQVSCIAGGFFAIWATREARLPAARSWTKDRFSTRGAGGARPCGVADFWTPELWEDSAVVATQLVVLC